MTAKNLMITLEEGLIKTCLLPVFSALVIACRASARTEERVILYLYYSDIMLVR